MSRAALFLDRDGVINRDFGYVGDRARFVFEDGIFDLARRARAHGYALIVVTNQSGIGRGYFSDRDFRVLTEWMAAQFHAAGAPLTAVYYCPCHPESTIREYRRDCDCRKPASGHFRRALVDWDLDASRSIMLGDRERDLAAAKSAGVATRYLYEPASAAGAAASERRLRLLNHLPLPAVPAIDVTDPPATCVIRSCREP